LKAVEITIPPDKSISHRAVMFASISKGKTRIKNLLPAEDIKRTIEAFRAMGVPIKKTNSGEWMVKGVGMRGLKKPSRPLYLGNSGTTMRILPGILAGQDFEVILTGDKSLSSRPMRRITKPLKEMGAVIEGKGSKHEIYPPLKLHGGRLKAINYKSKIASAQIKSCILSAGLFAEGVTIVTEPGKSRDHTERMLKMFGSRLKIQGRRVSMRGPEELKSPGAVRIPGDISSAAFFMAAGCILEGTKIMLRNIGLNPTRTGVIDILKKMGAEINTAIKKSTGEPSGNIVIKSSKLRGVTISAQEVVRAIDEIPIIMVAACFAKGSTVIKGIEELRVKETDRVHSMVTNLRKIGADIQAGKNVIIINGGKPLAGAKVDSFGDHRTAMSMLIAGLRVKGKLTVTGLGCINKSFPNFQTLLANVTFKTLS
jgi:3-phosphoshikimate 1-carboxyvinyltransferase